MRIKRSVAFLVSVGIAVAAGTVSAATDSEVTFEIHGVPVTGTPIAIPPFMGVGGASAARAREISSIINLDVSF